MPTLWVALGNGPAGVGEQVTINLNVQSLAAIGSVVLRNNNDARIRSRDGLEQSKLR